MRAAKRATALAMRVECNKKSNVNGGKSNGNKGGGRLTATRAMATVKGSMWAMAMVTRLAGDKEGKGEGGKGDCNSNEGGGQRRGQWQWRQEQWRGQQGWRASDDDGNKEDDGDGDKGGGQAMAAAMKRVMVLATRVACNEEGNGDSGKSNGNGNKVGGQVTASRAIPSATVMRGQWQRQ